MGGLEQMARATTASAGKYLADGEISELRKKQAG
jgi:hypothetical protein